jgi:signal transduction histidine kinase
MQSEEDAAARAALRRRAERLATLAAVARPVQHELNNLLTVIFANLDMVKRRVTEAAPLRQIDRVNEAARRFETSTRALLTLARRPVPAEAEASPGEVVAALRPLFGLLLPGPGALLIEIAPDLPACRFDSSMLEDALLALVRDAAEAEGPLRIGVAAAEGGVALTVGLPSAAAAKCAVALDGLRALAAAAGGPAADLTEADGPVLRVLLPFVPGGASA